MNGYFTLAERLQSDSNRRTEHKVWIIYPQGCPYETRAVCQFHLQFPRQNKERLKGNRKDSQEGGDLCVSGCCWCWHRNDEREIVREIERYIYESWPVAAGPRWFCRLIEIPPAAVTKNSRTDPQCRWLTRHLLLCRAVSVQFYRENATPLREKESMMEGFMDSWLGKNERAIRNGLLDGTLRRTLLCFFIV